MVNASDVLNSYLTNLIKFYNYKDAKVIKEYVLNLIFEFNVNINIT